MITQITFLSLALEFDKFLEERAKASETTLPSPPGGDPTPLVAPPGAPPGSAPNSARKKAERSEDTLFAL